MSDFETSTFRCPTCRAVQEWSDTCRRCKCDLRLLRAAERACRHSEARCLAELRAGRPAIALRHARECERLRPGSPARELVAVCAMLTGDWPTAVALAQSAGQADPNTASGRN